MCEISKALASQFQRRSPLKMLMMDAYLYYKLTYSPLSHGSGELVLNMKLRHVAMYILILRYPLSYLVSWDETSETYRYTQYILPFLFQF